LGVFRITLKKGVAVYTKRRGGVHKVTPYIRHVYIFYTLYIRVCVYAYTYESLFFECVLYIFINECVFLL
jgi:hypothetical protein